MPFVPIVGSRLRQKIPQNRFSTFLNQHAYRDKWGKLTSNLKKSFKKPVDGHPNLEAEDFCSWQLVPIIALCFGFHTLYKIMELKGNPVQYGGCTRNCKHRLMLALIQPPLYRSGEMGR